MRRSELLSGAVGLSAGLSSLVPGALCGGGSCAACFACVGAAGAAVSVFVVRTLVKRCQIAGSSLRSREDGQPPESSRST